MREEDYQISFEIIATAGDSKGYSMDAICDARKGDFESANEKLKEANQRLLQAHELQTDMIAKEAGGEQVPVNIILIHSQDHLTMANVAEELAEEMISLYKIIADLKPEIEEIKKTI